MHTAATPPSFTPPSAASGRSDARERELLACVALRDRQAFEELYVLYHRPLARFLMRLALRYELAEEVINDTFWVVWRQAERFRGDSRVSTWIMGIAYRRALKSLRRELTRHEREIGGDEQMIDLGLVEEPVRAPRAAGLDPARPETAAAGAADGRRARVLLWSFIRGNCIDHGLSAVHREGPNVSRPRPAAHDPAAARRSGGAMMTHDECGIASRGS